MGASFFFQLPAAFQAFFFQHYYSYKLYVIIFIYWMTTYFSCSRHSAELNTAYSFEHSRQGNKVVYSKWKMKQVKIKYSKWKMKEVKINISIAIHSKSIALFRHCLGLILVLNGLSYLIFENVRIISKHRIMAPRKSRIWPLNLFDLRCCMRTDTLIG